MNATFYLYVGAVGLLNGIAATWCARYKAYWRYVGIVGVAAFMAFLLLSLPSSGDMNARHVVANFLWAVPIPGFLALSPGLLVRKGSFGGAFLAGVLTTAIAAPIFVFYGAALSCLLMDVCL